MHKLKGVCMPDPAPKHIHILLTSLESEERSKNRLDRVTFSAYALSADLSSYKRATPTEKKSIYAKVTINSNNNSFLFPMVSVCTHITTVIWKLWDYKHASLQQWSYFQCIYALHCFTHVCSVQTCFELRTFFSWNSWIGFAICVQNAENTVTHPFSLLLCVSWLKVSFHLFSFVLRR